MGDFAARSARMRLLTGVGDERRDSGESSSARRRRPARCRARRQRPVGDALQREARDRGGDRRDPDPGRDQADDREHLGRVLDDAGESRGGQAPVSRSWKPGACSRGNSTSGSAASRRSGTRRSAASGWLAGSAATVRSRSTAQCAARSARSAAAPGRRRPSRADPPSCSRWGARAARPRRRAGRRGSAARSRDDRQQRRPDEVDAQHARGRRRSRGPSPPRRRAGEHRAGVAQERRAGRRQLDAPAGAGQQQHPELRLQRPDLLADSGGWEMCSRAAARRKCSSSATATK